MEPQAPTNITQLLSSVGKGDAVAASQLLEIVYSELHRLAARCMSRERVDRSLQTTGLVHEAISGSLVQKIRPSIKKFNFYNGGAYDNLKNDKNLTRALGNRAD